MDPDDATGVDEWFAERGYRPEVHADRPRYLLSLIGVRGRLHRSLYASGDSIDDAKSRARDRYVRELSEPPGEELRWSQPTLTMRAGDESWEPAVHIHNTTNTAVHLGGYPTAWGRLLRPDGSPVTDRGWRVLASCISRDLPPKGSTRIPVTLSLASEEKASLPPGRYRLVDVAYSELTAPDIDVDIRDD